MTTARTALVFSVVAIALAATSYFHGRPVVEPVVEKAPAAMDPEHAGYVPGLGEIMTMQQMRHAKLALAGAAGNWDLADYETDELGEGFDDIVTYHPTHKDIKQPLTELVPQFTKQAVADLRDAVKAKDVDKFNTAFDGLTAGCNGCHQATAFGFNVVLRPTTSSFPNQQFTPAK